MTNNLLNTRSEKGQKYTKVKANGYIYWVRNEIMDVLSENPEARKLYHKVLMSYSEVVYSVWDSVIVKQRRFESNQEMLDYLLENSVI